MDSVASVLGCVLHLLPGRLVYLLVGTRDQD